MSRCVFCSATKGFVEVDGHLQCLSCGQNVEPCCQGSPDMVCVNKQKEIKCQKLPVRSN